MTRQFIFFGPNESGSAINAETRSKANASAVIGRGGPGRNPAGRVQPYGAQGREYLSTWDILTEYSAALSGGALE